MDTVDWCLWKEIKDIIQRFIIVTNPDVITLQPFIWHSPVWQMFGLIPLLAVKSNIWMQQERPWYTENRPYRIHRNNLVILKMHYGCLPSNIRNPSAKLGVKSYSAQSEIYLKWTGRPCQVLVTAQIIVFFKRNKSLWNNRPENSWNLPACSCQNWSRRWVPVQLHHHFLVPPQVSGAPLLSERWSHHRRSQLGVAEWQHPASWVDHAGPWLERRNGYLDLLLDAMKEARWGG